MIQCTLACKRPCWARAAVYRNTLTFLVAPTGRQYERRKLFAFVFETGADGAKKWPSIPFRVDGIEH